MPAKAAAVGFAIALPACRTLAVGPVLSEDRLAVRVDLAEGDGFESRSFESKGKSSYSAEQINVKHTLPAFP